MRRQQTLSINTSDSCKNYQLESLQYPKQGFSVKETKVPELTETSLVEMALANISGIPDKHWQPPFVAFETTMGEIVIELYWKHGPITCRNFAELSRRGYYNGTKFHRVIRDFMIQGGDPTGTGKGGVSIYGECFDDEVHDDLKHTGAGVVSMANSGPNTNGSQFFITLAPTQWLDGKHTIFGRVHTGMTIVKRIGLVETDKNDKPVDDIKIVKGSIRNA